MRPRKKRKYTRRIQDTDALELNLIPLRGVINYYQLELENSKKLNKNEVKFILDQTSSLIISTLGLIKELKRSRHVEQ